jgi:hypothetical protein
MLDGEAADATAARRASVPWAGRAQALVESFAADQIERSPFGPSAEWLDRSSGGRANQRAALWPSNVVVRQAGA